jgi:hypothetical protein
MCKSNGGRTSGTFPLRTRLASGLTRLPKVAAAATLRPDRRAWPRLSPASAGRLGCAFVGSVSQGSAGRFPPRTAGNHRVTRRDESCVSGVYACYAPTRTSFTEHPAEPMVPVGRLIRLSFGGRQPGREASSAEHGRSSGLSQRLRRECGRRRLGDRSVIAKDDVAKPPVRLLGDRQTQRKVFPVERPAAWFAHIAQSAVACLRKG